MFFLHISTVCTHSFSDPPTNRYGILWAVCLRHFTLLHTNSPFLCPIWAAMSSCSRSIRLILIWTRRRSARDGIGVSASRARGRGKRPPCLCGSWMIQTGISGIRPNASSRSRSTAVCFSSVSSSNSSSSASSSSTLPPSLAYRGKVSTRHYKDHILTTSFRFLSLSVCIPSPWVVLPLERRST
jgi:hypothetical protein